MTVTDYPDYATSQDHANKIAATGVPLTHLKTLIDRKSGLVIPGGSNVILPSNTTFYNFTQIAYEIALQLVTSASTATRVGIQLLWSDSVSGLTTEIENISCYAASGTTGHSVIGRGPTRGDELEVLISAPDNTITVNLVILQSSRIWARSHWRTTIAGLTPVFPGFTSSIMDPDAGWLASVNTAVAASGAPATLMPLYTGTVTVAGATTDATAGNSELRINSTSDAFSAIASSTLYRIANGQGQSFKPGIILAGPIALPATQCQLVQSNGNTTTTETINGNVLAHESKAG